MYDFIDWIGDQPELLIDSVTGEIRKVHVFATTLGFTSRVCADIFPDEKLPSFIASVVHALKCYGTVLNHLVPNNLKNVIPKHSKDKLILNSAFHLCYCNETGHNCGRAAGNLLLD